VQGGVIGEPQVIAEPQDRGGLGRHVWDVGMVWGASMTGVR
jgi:hypothetical protein